MTGTPVQQAPERTGSHTRKEGTMPDKPNEINIKITSQPGGGLDVSVSSDEDKKKKESTQGGRMKLHD